jgi:hypothetical protein
MSSTEQFFDRVVVVNLARRPERIERFWAQLGDWPLKRPERVDAVDGEAVGVPAGWDKGPGAYGCLLSHRGLLGKAIADHVRQLLVLEDDALPVPGFAALVPQFLSRVPDDWDGLMLGCQHLLPPLPVAEGIVRCMASNRTHAYAVRGPFMKMLLHFWSQTTNDHCDLVLSSLMRHYKVYAPEPLLIGQDAGHSDVTGRGERLRFISDQDKDTIAAKNNPRHRVERLVTRVDSKRSAIAELQARKPVYGPV